MPRKVSPDYFLFLVVLGLLGLGVVMVYSSSAILAMDRFHDPYFFLKKQCFWAVLGLGVLWSVMSVDYRRWRSFVFPLMAVAFALLFLVLIPPFGQEINGTRRWLRWGPFSFQPTELAKLALVLYLADFLARRQVTLERFWRGFFPPLLVTGAMAALIMRQPDLGSSVALVAVILCMLFQAGARLSHMALVGAAAVPVIVVAVTGASYRLRRVFAFLDPWADPRGAGFQIIQSYLALGGGGLTGRGLGESKQKLFYLPEPHTDFIFAIVGEELGFVGAVVTVALFSLLLWRGVRIGLRVADPFGALAALGITAMLTTQALVNLGVVVGLLPTKGLPLPFVSFGGSSLLVAMAGVGVLLNISQHADV
ncbi:MAG TPA: putative lipid II flippase FtsW [Methylomirabilota bacterium]|nr:putative lipid II flippase FtsW [Methylomirabilota bacterium]